MIQPSIWDYFTTALCLVFIVAVIVYIAWLLIRRGRKKVVDLPEPRDDPDYPVRRTGER